MANESLIVGNSNWAVKANNLLGYAVGETSGYYVPRELNFTRNSTATYTDENGIIQTAAANIARVQDNALLLEPQRTNLVTYSNEFDNAAWTILTESTSTMSITPNYATAQNGLSASRLVATRPSTSFLSLLANFVSDTNTATKSVWIKNNNSGSVNINISDQAITVTDTWQRYEITNNYPHATIGLRYASADLNCDISIAGFQFEAGSYATTYIPTTSATVTRLADSCSKTGISSLIGQTEGTLYWEGRTISGVGTDLLIIGDITNSVFINITSSNQVRIGIRANNGLLLSPSGGTIAANNKIALAYKSGDIVAYLNGIEVITNSTSFTFSDLISSIEIGRPFYDAKATQFNQASALFTTRLTNTQLAELTTL
jgi:hypothetical protein